MKFSGQTYEILKWLCLIALPAISTFISQVFPAMDVPDKTVALITTIISAFSLLIGTLIGVSTVNYRKDNSDVNNLTIELYQDDEE